jgi:CHAD domain-containing protein
MKQSTIKKVIKKQFSKLQQAYDDMLIDCPMAAIHRFRVSVKHIRAFTRMIKTGSKKKFAIPGKLKKLYVQSGTVRNWQLFIQTFSRNRSLNRYAVRRLDAATDNLRQLMTKNLVSKAGAKMLQQVPRHFENEGMRAFRHNKIKAIEQFAHQKKLADEELHAIRKSLKDLQYDKLLTGARAKKKYYKKLTEKIGSLQDCRIELQLLQEINQQQSSTRIQKLVNNSLQKKNRLAGEITRELNMRAS